MSHYVDIHLLPDPEFASPVLMNVLYSALHKVLAELASDWIGVSFPQYQPQSLGKVLRLHSDQDQLKQLMARSWYEPMLDYITVEPVRAVPANSGWVTVRRIQPKTGVERARRRLMRRHDISMEEAQRRIPDGSERYIDLPFIQLKSTSTQQQFRLFITQQSVPERNAGTFNAYGLSRQASLPFF